MDGAVVPTTPTTAVSLVARTGRRYARPAVLGGLWLFGLLSVFLLPAPVAITPEMQKRHDLKRGVAEQHELETDLAFSQYLEARRYTDAARVWFWRFQPDAREEVAKRRITEKEAYERYRLAQAQYRAAVSEARSELGVWTHVGVDASRAMFWEAYHRGKLFARSQTLSDVILDLLFRRDMDTFGRLINLLGSICVNFATGMISALFIFLANLPSFILSFKPSFLSGMLFFMTSFVGSLSVIITFLALLYLTSFVIMAVTASTFQPPQSHQGTPWRLRTSHRPHLE